MFIFGYKFIRKTKRVVPAAADLVTGKEMIGMIPDTFLPLIT